MGVLRRAFSVLVSTVVISGLVVPMASATPDGGAQGAQWTATADGPAAYPGQVHIDWDVPITMSDGTVLKANVYRPVDAAGRIVETPTPTIVTMTPYTKLVSMIGESAMSVPVLPEILSGFLRDFDLSGIGLGGLTELTKTVPGGIVRAFSVDRKLVQSGYTYVVADVRGTGFSQGVWDVFQEREKQDTVEVIDWASKQPWSTGDIGMTGISYSAINQVYAAEKRPEALKAIVPVEPGNDLLRDVVATGGALGFGFIPPWLIGVNALKLVPDLQSLFTGTFDWRWLADRVQNPAVFVDYIIAALATMSVAEVPDNLKTFLDADSPLREGLRGNPDRVQIPTMVVGGWHDIFAYSEPRIYNAIPLPPGQKQLIMGDGYHGTPASDFGRAGYPPRIDVLQRAWFDKWLKGIDNGIDGYGPVTLAQQGGTWTTTDQFPRAGMEYQRMYLSATASGTTNSSLHDGSLTPEPGGLATLTVGPGVMSLCSRDNAQITAGVGAILDICAKDARAHELNGLTFTSAPVSEPTLLSGPVNLHLNTMLDTTDGYWTATVNDVAPDGRSTVWTSGQLMASLRAVDEERATRSANGDYTDPYPILSLATRQAIVPGVPTTLDLGLMATDGVLQPGHRLRIDVFASNFPRGLPLRPLLNESGLAQQHIVIDPSSPSFVNVPLSRPIQ
ncbi:CocE/NonD family hydrolase [Antrihabitans stalactiti]|uniref:CocE/NonD family hydrolase n=1 Tax=Antrihabitans stalactiti TaxID=2584121 RepID=A0A848KA08_9NOCA|nr:CocE/NonD family hydrolase [Antrihabitans stalactiti]NMN95179.1 CocE/NonD family hydrolase [Antrihabitans stalactiti]